MSGTNTNTKELPKFTEEFLQTATVKEKAALYCQYLAKSKEPSQQEQIALVENINNPKDKREFRKYYRYYRTIVRIFPTLFLYWELYVCEAEKSHAFLRLCSEYEADAKALTEIRDRLAAAGEGKAVRIFEETACSVPREYCRFRVEGDRILADCSELFNSVRVRASDTDAARLSWVKAGIVTIENWIETHRLKDFVPTEIAESLRDWKRDFAEEEGLGEYSRGRIYKKRATGQSVTEEEEAIAVLPCYEETACSEKLLDLWTGKLEEYEIH